MDIINFILGFGFLAIIFGLVAAVFSIILFVFWVSMIIDCVKRKFKDDMEKVVWLLVIIFLGILGALIYYFLVKREKEKGKRKR
jgi:hypothetical protein